MKKVTFIASMFAALLFSALHLQAQVSPHAIAHTEQKNYYADFADQMHAHYFPETAPAAESAPAVGTTNTLWLRQKLVPCHVWETFHRMVFLAHKTAYPFIECHDLSLHGADWRLPICSKPAWTYSTFVHH